MKSFGAGDKQDLTKDIMQIKFYEDTEVNHVIEFLLLMVHQDTTSTEGEISELKAPTEATEESVKISMKRVKEEVQIDIEKY